jgi:uncharacterized membrane protein (Fun14 family)|tara:strand:- start:7115 stop:7243 length:129 start_codon:yes stop_codon:yes gene_type:complete
MDDLVRRFYHRLFHRFLVGVYVIALAYHLHYGFVSDDDEFFI